MGLELLLKDVLFVLVAVGTVVAPKFILIAVSNPAPAVVYHPASASTLEAVKLWKSFPSFDLVAIELSIKVKPPPAASVS